MLDAGKFIIKKDGMVLEDLSTVTSRVCVPTVLDDGEVRHFSKATFIDERDRHLWLRATGNEVEAAVIDMATVILPDSSFSMPPFERWQTAKVSAGHMPGGDKMLVIGQPETALEVHFLGHPLREEMTALMAGDKPDSTEIFFEDHERTGQLLFSGTSVPVSMTGFGETEHIVFGNRNPQDYTSHSGEVMLGAYLQTKKSGPKDQSIEVFAATKSHEDGLIRVHQSDPYVSLRFARDGGASRVVDELAALSVFATTLANPDYTALHTDFPLPLVDYVMKDLHIRRLDGHSGEGYDRLRNNYGFDWQSIRADLPSEQIRMEQNRLVDVFQIVYEAPSLNRPRSSRRKRHSANYMPFA